MQDIQSLKSMMPIIVNGDVLQFLTSNYISWYTNNLRSDYYNAYSDLNFKRDLKKRVIMSVLKQLSTEYLLGIQSDNEVRMILLRNKVPIAGCSIYLDKENYIDMSYFVEPSHQRMGIGFNMMGKLIYTLDNSCLRHNGYKLVIREDNARSLNLGYKLGFTVVGGYMGKTRTNKILLKLRLGKNGK